MKWNIELPKKFWQQNENEKKDKKKVSKYDDRMMEDGTLNVDHPSLKNDNGMSISEYNAHLMMSDGGV